MDQVKHKEGWDDTTLHMIEWDAHGIAVANTRETRPFIIKLLNDLLPTGS